MLRTIQNNYILAKCFSLWFRLVYLAALWLRSVSTLTLLFAYASAPLSKRFNIFSANKYTYQLVERSRNQGKII